MHLSKVAVHIFQSPPRSPRSPSPRSPSPPPDEFTTYIADEDETESVAESYTGANIALGDKTPLYQGSNFYTVSVSNTFQDN